MWSRPWIITLVAFTGSTLLFGESLLARPAGTLHTITLAISSALLAAMVGAGVFILRPASRDLKRGLRLSRQGDAGAARLAYQRVIDSGRAREAPVALVSLGNILFGQGDAEGARAAYQRAIESGSPASASVALFNLGILLARQGDDEGARAAYQQVIGMPGARPAPKASLNLGILLAEQGDAEGARTAYQWAIDRGPRDVRKLARLALQELDGTDHSG